MILEKLKAFLGDELLENKVKRQTATTVSTAQPATPTKSPLPSFNAEKCGELENVQEAETMSDVVNQRKLTRFFPDAWNVSTRLQQTAHNGLQEVAEVGCPMRNTCYKLIPKSVNEPSGQVTLYVSTPGNEEEAEEYPSLVAAFKSIGKRVLEQETEHGLLENKTEASTNAITNGVKNSQSDPQLIN